MSFALPENMTGIVEWGQYLNTVTEGFLWCCIIFFVSSAFFIAFATVDDMKRAGVGASIVFLLLSFVFFLIDFVSVWMVVVGLGLVFAAIIYLYASNEFIG